MVSRGSTATAQELEGLTKGELLSVLSFGADRIFAAASGQGALRVWGGRGGGFEICCFVGTPVFVRANINTRRHTPNPKPP
jgi:hypothetical protein